MQSRAGRVVEASVASVRRVLVVQRLRGVLVNGYYSCSSKRWKEDKRVKGDGQRRVKKEMKMIHSEVVW